jgi:hypothetical protein
MKVVACLGVGYITNIFRTNGFHGSNSLVADAINSGESTYVRLRKRPCGWRQ